jgi:maleate isomerase
VLIVADEPIPEAELWAMAPPGVSIHAARVTARAPWAAVATSGQVVPVPDLARGTEQLGRMQLDAIVVGHSSSSFVGGSGWDKSVAAHLATLSNGVPVSTNGLDTLAALHSLGLRRPFLVLPPWYSDTIVEGGCRYFAAHGVELAGHLRFDPGFGWRDLPPGRVHTDGGVWVQDPEPLYRQIRRACPTAADGVVIAGTGFRAVAVIEPLEQDLGRPVLTANQVSLWNCLRLAGVRAPVVGYGRLFDLGASTRGKGDAPGAGAAPRVD